VVVGVAQTVRRPKDSVAGLPAPHQMMAEAVRLAADDSGAGSALLDRIQSLRTVESLSWRAPDPAGLVAGELGIEPAERVRSATGGNSPQMLLNDAAAAIQRGELDAVAIVGAEAMYTRRIARQTGEELGWPRQDDSAAAGSRVLGSDKFGSHEAEMARGLTAPIQVYPVLECAIRAASGATVDDHQVKISELLARFSAVAADNPHAWSRERRTAEEIRAVTPDNRMICHPYTLRMNANMQVDQAAAVILCSVETARAAGIADDKWVFPLAGADATDHWFVSHRDNLHSSPAIKACATAALELAGVGVDDLAHIDLYSCFTSAVQMGAEAFGLRLDGDRELTVTGGLSYAGGPGNNYVTHSIATIVDRLRRDDGAVGLVTALGWYATKHAVGLYSTTPPAAGFRTAAPQHEIDTQPARVLAADYEGDATVEAYTVVHDRDGEPQTAIVGLLTPHGARTWANTTEPGVMKALTIEDFAGRAAKVSGGAVTVG
jgi:acetyl-CoA C-acetyltransferase